MALRGPPLLTAAAVVALLTAALGEDSPPAPPEAPPARPQLKLQPDVVPGDNPRAALEVDPKSRLLLAPVSLNGVAGRFILGTGAPHSIVTPEFAGKTGLDRTTVTVGTIGGGEAKLGRIQSLKVGAMDFANFDVRILSLERFAQHLERPPDGILGADVLLAIPVTVDYAAKSLIFGRPSDLSNRKELPADLFARHLVVPGTVEGEKVDFVLDTGANVSAVAKASYRGRTEQGQGLAFAVPEEPVRIGDTVLGHMRFVLGDHNILGIDFFQRYVVTLDALQKKIYIQEGATAVATPRPQSTPPPPAKPPAETPPPSPTEPLPPALEKQITDLQSRLLALQEEEYKLVNRMMATQEKALETLGITPDELTEGVEGRRISKAFRDYKALLAAFVEQLRAFDTKYAAVQRQIRAMEADRKAAEAKPHLAELASQVLSQRRNLWHKIADLCERGGDFKTAIAIYETEIQALTELKSTAEIRPIREKLGDAYDKINEHQKAVAAYKTVYDSIPPHERVQNINFMIRLAFLYEKANDPRKALDVYLEIQKILPPGAKVEGLADKITSLKSKVGSAL